MGRAVEELGGFLGWEEEELVNVLGKRVKDGVLVAVGIEGGVEAVVKAGDGLSNIAGSVRGIVA